MPQYAPYDESGDVLLRINLLIGGICNVSIVFHQSAAGVGQPIVSACLCRLTDNSGMTSFY
jgi:hypothetical protein